MSCTHLCVFVARRHLFVNIMLLICEYTKRMTVSCHTHERVMSCTHTGSQDRHAETTHHTTTYCSMSKLHYTATCHAHTHTHTWMATILVSMTWYGSCTERGTCTHKNYFKTCVPALINVNTIIVFCLLSISDGSVKTTQQMYTQR